MTIITGVAAGEGFDINARLVARHLGNHLPGHPSVVVKNLPGANQVLAANYLATGAAADGSVIGAISPSIITHQLIDGRGVRYDVRDFQWLGASDHGNIAIYSWAASGVATIHDLLTREVIAGATGPVTYEALYPALMNHLLGTRLKVLVGYKSSKELEIALQRGEVELRAGQPTSTVKTFYGEWVRARTINLIAQAGRERDPDFAGVPLLTELAASDTARRVFEFFAIELDVGRPFLAPAGTPPDRLAALRAAFDATMNDPDFLTEAFKAGVDVHPLPAAAVAGFVGKAAATPTDLLAAARRARGDDMAR